MKPFDFLKNLLNRDPSDDMDIDRQGSTGQQLQTLGTDEGASTNIASSLSSIKLKSKRRNIQILVFETECLFLLRCSCSGWILNGWR